MRTFHRDRFTWLAYAMLAYFAYVQAALGPAMPFIREELGLSFTVAGLHFSALAAGMIAAGITGAALVRRVGRPAVFWGGGGGMAAGAVLLVLGDSVALTISAALIMGLFGTYLLNLIPATLSDRHGNRRATAVTEANVAASAATIFPPLVIGALAGTVFGWRSAFWLAGLAWLLLTLFNARVPVPLPVNGSGPAGGTWATLPRRFWLVWGLIIPVVAAEWSVTAWSADFLAEQVGLARALAAGLMTAYFSAMVIGRFVGSRLTLRHDALSLLPAALGLALAGFGLFWLAPLPVLNVTGLFVAGLGIANLFPLSLAAATTAAGDQTDHAGALVSLAAGIAILLAPQTLGAMADAVGILGAMGLVIVLLLAAVVMAALARSQQQAEQTR